MAKSKRMVETPDELIKRVKGDVDRELKEYFACWHRGMIFKNFFCRYALPVKRAGITLNDLAYALQDRGVIIIRTTPKGRRYIFPGDLNWSDDVINDHLTVLELGI